MQGIRVFTGIGLSDLGKKEPQPMAEAAGWHDGAEGGAGAHLILLLTPHGHGGG